MLLADRAVIALAVLAILWPAAAPLAATEIGAAEWRVVEIAGKPSDGAGTLAIKDGKATGKAACNRYFAQLIAGPAKGELELGPIGATRMFCEGKMETEKALFDALGAVRSYRLDGAVLLLADIGGKTVVKLAR